MILITELSVLCHVSYDAIDLTCQFKTKTGPFMNFISFVNFIAFVIFLIFFLKIMSADRKVICQAGRNANKAYTARMLNWTLYSLQNHCRVEYPDGEETCVE